MSSLVGHPSIEEISAVIKAMDDARFNISRKIDFTFTAISSGILIKHFFQQIFIKKIQIK